MATVLEPAWTWTPQGLRAGVHVHLHEGRITRVADPAGGARADVHLPHHLLLPGFVNAHSHAFQRAIRGHVQQGSASDSFWAWRDRMYAAARRLDPDGVGAVSALAFLEMVQAGITHVGEFHYLHHQPSGAPYADPDELAHRVIEAARRVGLRITLLRVAYARAGAGQPPRPEQARFVDADPDAVLAALARLQALTAADDGVRIGLAAHSVRALGAPWLRALAAWEGLVHAHVSEQPAENDACLAEHGRSPLSVLAEAGLVRPAFTAVHLTWPLPGDVDQLVAAGGGVCACPTTELDLGDGFLSAEIAQRLPVSLGTDSHAAIDLLLEARSLEWHARAVGGRRLVLAGPGGLADRLLHCATTAGDRALGGPGAGIAAGAPADLVAVDLDRVAAHGVPPLEAAVFNATPEWVQAVWVAGKQVVAGGVHPAAAEIRAEAAPYLG